MFTSHHTEKAKEKIRQSKIAEKNPNWKGNDVRYGALHRRIWRLKPRPQFCEDCKTGRALDLANISQEYKYNVSDWEWLCRKCHMRKDGRMKNLEIGRLKMNEMRKDGFMSGSKSPQWRGGMPSCEVCKKQLHDRRSKLCVSHRYIARKRGENGMFTS